MYPAKYCGNTIAIWVAPGGEYGEQQFRILAPSGAYWRACEGDLKAKSYLAIRAWHGVDNPYRNAERIPLVYPELMRISRHRRETEVTDLQITIDSCEGRKTTRVSVPASVAEILEDRSHQHFESWCDNLVAAAAADLKLADEHTYRRVDYDLAEIKRL